MKILRSLDTLTLWAVRVLMPGALLSGSGLIVMTMMATPAHAGDFGDVSPTRARFDHSRTIVPPDQLPFARHNRRARMTDADIKHQLETIHVTSDGIVRTQAASSHDIRIFRQSLSGQQRDLGDTSTTTIESAPGYRTPSGTSRSVIGRDTRQRISRTTGYPYRAIGQLGVGCSGTLIGPRHVLTAAHCVYNLSNHRWYSNLNFAPGRSGTRRPYGGVPWKSVVTTRGWTRYGLRSADYAMVILKRDIGTRVGWMGFGWRPTLPKFSINIVGYPGDKRPRYTMWASRCKINRVLPTRLYYNCDTSGGMSGSPVYVYWSSTRKRLIYGIHAYGLDSTRLNSATRITQSVFTTLRRWKANL